MAVACARVITWLEKLAPKSLAEDWDAIGLQVGEPAAPVEKIYLALDIDMAVVEAAVEKGCQMIVAHHPLLFKPVSTLRWDLPLGKVIKKIVGHNIQIYAAHTNLDSAIGGVNDILAKELGLQEVEPLTDNKAEDLVKIVVFVPVDHEQPVRKAMGEAGAGHIGNYSHCTFRTMGKGTFFPLEGADPFIGKVGAIEEVEEVRLETIVPKAGLSRVLKAMLKAHPYEEVAYDVYPLLNQDKVTGLGRIGLLAKPMTIETFVHTVKKALEIDTVRWIGAEKEKLVQKVAVCGGSGASLIHKASFKGADLLVTGDVKYHEAQTAQSLGLDIIDPGHFATERPVLDHLAAFLREMAQQEKVEIEVCVHEVSQDPFTFI